MKNLKTFALAILMAASAKGAMGQNGIYNMLTHKNDDRRGAKTEYLLDVSLLNSTQHVARPHKAPRGSHIGMAINAGIRFTGEDYDSRQMPITLGTGLEYQLINENGILVDTDKYATYRRHSIYLTGTVNYFITPEFYAGLQIKGGMGFGTGGERNFVYGERIELGHKIGNVCEVFTAWGFSDFSNWRYGSCWKVTSIGGQYEFGMRALINAKKVREWNAKKRAIRAARSR